MRSAGSGKGAVTRKGTEELEVALMPSPKAAFSTSGAWALANNAVPPSDMLVIHSCDNPPCVNPAHLSLGDAKENTRQMMERERNGFSPSIGERNGNSKLTSEDVFYIKTALSRGISGAAVGRCFGVKKETISSIARGLTWRSITIGDKN